jgi:hypothetical protein
VKIVGTRQSGAIFSDCMKYRYRLWRCWNSQLPRACFILLNPSTADEVHNDPTIERQWRRVKRWQISGRQFGAVEVVNAFAWRSTDPAALYQVDDPFGPQNWDALSAAVFEARESGGIVICGWGTHAKKVAKYDEFLYGVTAGGVPLSAFKLNSDGTPQHPLYLGYDLIPRRWVNRTLYEPVVEQEPETAGLFDGLVAEGLGS